jgi:glutathione peroxidase
MHWVFLWLSMFLMVVSALMVSVSNAHGAQCPPLLEHRFNRLQDGQAVDLCQYAGKVVLVVNTASYCGFTNQYEGLEKLHADYAGRGLVVLGFPANDFANQEPGTNKEIATFCRRTYGVEFLMFEKSQVVGGNANPLYKALGERTGERPKWNFHKYLIGRDGKEVLSFGTSVAPGDVRLVSSIERLLKASARP